MFRAPRQPSVCTARVCRKNYASWAFDGREKIPCPKKMTSRMWRNLENGIRLEGETTLTGENNKNGLVHGYVLAGGGSTRFGGDKALAIFDGTPMLLRMKTLLRSVVKKVRVIAPPQKYASVGITSVADRWE